MNLAISLVRRFWPIFLFVLLEVILFATNYTAGTYLFGWDNVTPELGFPLHFVRSIVGVWQENRGLGLFDGMSHIANLLHTVFLSLLSFALPQNLLRYTFVFAMHLTGGIGMFFLIKKLFHSSHHVPIGLACIGGLFYLYNLITTQMFFAPLEAFAVHFASLPWLALTLRSYLSEGHRRSLRGFITVSFLATPQYFVTTLFLPVTLLLGVFSICALLFSRTLFMVKRVAMAGIYFLLINAFWLLPYIVGLPHNAPVIANAKINQMSSEEVFSRNQAFGRASDVMLLRGYTLDFEDQGVDDAYGYMMAPWRNHIDNPSVFLLHILIAGLTIAGIIVGLRREPQQLLPVFFLFLAGFMFLANDTAGVQVLTSAFREHIPFFAEAFRFPFTKFSLLFVFAYTILFTAGVFVFLNELFHHPKRVSHLMVAATLTVVIWTTAPAFFGNFIYERLRIELPQDYIKLFSYMQQVDPNKRMALLPQPAYWSWKFFSYGYRGSGFFWQGIPQPTMDRAFDPWSHTNENYYWELSRALYAKDIQSMEDVLDKYDISYILLDEYMKSATTNRALFIDETKQLVSQIPGTRHLATFGKLTLYERDAEKHKNFIDISQNLPVVTHTYDWTDNDIAFAENGNYISPADGATSVSPAQSHNTYPFRSLFTKRALVEREFTIKETFETIDIHAEDESGYVRILKPETQVYDSALTQDLSASSVVQCGLLKQGTASALEGIESNKKYLRFDSVNQRGCLSFDIPELPHKDGYLVAIDYRHLLGRPLLLSIINRTAKHVELETYLTKPSDTEWQTEYFILPPLARDGLGYDIYISNDAIGTKKTINDIGTIRVYTLPYGEMVHLKTATHAPTQNSNVNTVSFSVSHPNPAYYKVVIDNQPSAAHNQTLILSQSFDAGWLAFERINTFPYFSRLTDHVLVNNWANGWSLQNTTNTPTDQLSHRQIIIFFWPQLLQFVGFLLLPLPFVWTIKR